MTIVPFDGACVHHLLYQRIRMDLSPASCHRILGRRNKDRLFCCLLWPVHEQMILLFPGLNINDRLSVSVIAALLKQR